MKCENCGHSDADHTDPPGWASFDFPCYREGCDCYAFVTTRLACGHERAYFGARFFSQHTGCVEGCPWPEECKD